MDTSTRVNRSARKRGGRRSGVEGCFHYYLRYRRVEDNPYGWRCSECSLILGSLLLLCDASKVSTNNFVSGFGMVQWKVLSVVWIMALLKVLLFEAFHCGKGALKGHISGCD